MNNLRALFGNRQKIKYNVQKINYLVEAYSPHRLTNGKQAFFQKK